MSFRLFVYYCAVLGGLAAYVGWVFGRILLAGPTHHLLNQGLKGLWVGLLIGFLLGLLDARWNLSLGRFGPLFFRSITAGIIGAAGGLLGGIVGQALYDKLDLSFFVIFGWTITGREAWLKVEAGFRSGRELILSKPLITIGRAESCDVGLFGDPAIERRHALIQRQGGDYVIMDEGTQSGTYVNGERITAPRVLHAGDAIRVGRCVLRFGERAKARG
jgi:hypothetical protein